MVKEKVPYISFNDLGDEITKYREVEIEKNIKIGEEEKQATVPAYTAIQKDIFGFCYSKIKQKLLESFPYLEIKEV